MTTLSESTSLSSDILDAVRQYTETGNFAVFEVKQNTTLKYRLDGQPSGGCLMVYLIKPKTTLTIGYEPDPKRLTYPTRNQGTNGIGLANANITLNTYFGTPQSTLISRINNGGTINIESIQTGDQPQLFVMKPGSKVVTTTGVKFLGKHYSVTELVVLLLVMFMLIVFIITFFVYIHQNTKRREKEKIKQSQKSFIVRTT